jgi:acetyltransferase-like isoleucine patch superfamily enzyme
MGVTINYNTTIGSRVKIMDNTHLTGNMTIEDDVFVSTLVSTTNDNSMGREAALKVPPELRSRHGPIIRRHATIGQGACILPGIEIGENAMIGANSVVTGSIPARVLALGVPARIVRQLRESEIKR